MRSRSIVSAFLATLLFGASAFGDELATGDPATLLDIDDGFVEGLVQPTGLTVLADGRIVITERQGRVRVRATDGMLIDAGSFTVNSGPGEQGLLNVVAHPEFATNRILFFYYSAGAAAEGTSEDRHRVVSIELGADNRLVMSTEKILLRGLRGPANHNGGALSIYGDKLFIGSGDTGSNSGAHPSKMVVRNYYPTCLTNANGKVLRINLDGSIPDDNPLVGKMVTACGNAPGTAPTGTSAMARTEIWAWGFRNAFRVWADPKTGNVWVGDVGEVTYEEINVIPKAGGLHFGWPYREGNEGQPGTTCTDIEPDVGNCVEPTYFCEQNGQMIDGVPNNPDVPNQCESITGGLIIDGCEWPAALEGRYVFGDYFSGSTWTLQVNPQRSGTMGERVDFADMEGPIDFAEHDGALYMLSHAGHLTRIVPKEPEPACNGTGGGGTGGSNNGGAAGSSGASAGADGGGAPNGGAAPTGGRSNGGADNGGSGNAGPMGGSNGMAGSGGSGSDDGGCGCRVAGANKPILGALGLATVLAAFGLARRQRRRR